MHPHAKAFLALFEGFTQAHGIYNIKSTGPELTSGKIKGAAASIVGSVDEELWSQHLEGKQGLGIIPINENSKCRFGVIDVDDYDRDPSSFCHTIKRHGLPLIPCRTKSGGTHLYCFLSEFIPASTMIAKLSEFASILGVGGSEIFPKQAHLLVERGDAGSWINMPYFGGTNTDRFAFDHNGLPIKDPEKFLDYASDKMVDAETLSSILTQLEFPLGKDAPPCLNCLCTQGFPEGTRNNGLMQAGILMIKRNPDEWAQKLDEFNSQHMTPPLASKEVLGIVNSLKKKEYKYLCNQQPMKAHCDKVRCRLVKYGIGSTDGMPTMGTLTKFNTMPPVWFLDVDGGGRLELSTDDLQQPLRFQRACMDQMNIMPPVLKREDWSTVVSDLLKSVNIVEVPADGTPKGILQTLLEEFLQMRKTYEENVGREAILHGQVWIEPDDSGVDTAFFRSRDFIEFLQVKRFNDLPTHKIIAYLRELGVEHKFLNIKGKGVNCQTMPASGKITVSPFTVPKQNTNEIV